MKRVPKALEVIECQLQLFFSMFMRGLFLNLALKGLNDALLIGIELDAISALFCWVGDEPPARVDA
ncbi:MAG: hypothetical protein K0S07_842 [Chlamydiales bacterium]|nr:hypothetical protein [Chlamydiales bacterium]